MEIISRMTEAKFQKMILGTVDRLISRSRRAGFGVGTFAPRGFAGPRRRARLHDVTQDGPPQVAQALKHSSIIARESVLKNQRVREAHQIPDLTRLRYNSPPRTNGRADNGPRSGPPFFRIREKQPSDDRLFLRERSLCVSFFYHLNSKRQVGVTLNASLPLLYPQSAWISCAIRFP